MATRVIEQSEVAPPPGSLPSPTILPLTFLDITWFCCKPIKRIFFYHFPHPTHHFLQTTLPILKHSLSITLQHFFPYSSNIIIPPNSENVPPYIRYLNGDSLSFTVAESSSTNFNLLISDSSQDVQNWHPFVPNLPSPHIEHNDTRVVPIMAIQVTILPNSGFAICLAYNHVAGDGKSLHQFMKFWSYVSKAKTNNKSLSLEHSLPLDLLPSHERDRVKDPKNLKLTYLQELKGVISEFTGHVQDPNNYVNKVRITLVLSHEQVLKLKKLVADHRCKETSLQQHMLSTFVVTCSLIWFCMIKSEQQRKGGCAVVDGDDLCYLVFHADCRDRPEISLPVNYFGNCLASNIVVVKRVELVGTNGIVAAANGIERRIRDFKSDNALLGAERWTSDFRELSKPSKSVVGIAGSPKFDVYETDFGWGKPKKSDAVQLDSSASISLSDCRDGGGGIQVGLALEKIQMANFIKIFQQQLDQICL